MKTFNRKAKTLSLSLVAISMFWSVQAQADRVEEAIHLNRAKVTEVEAMQLIQQAYPGSIYEFEFEEHEGVWVYEAEVVDQSKGKLNEVLLNPETSEIKLRETEKLAVLGFNRFDEGEQAALDLIEATNYSLVGHLAKLKAEQPGYIQEVELEHSKGVSYYKVKMLSQDGAKKKVILDIENNSMIPVMDRD